MNSRTGIVGCIVLALAGCNVPPDDTTEEAGESGEHELVTRCDAETPVSFRFRIPQTGERVSVRVLYDSEESYSMDVGVNGRHFMTVGKRDGLDFADLSPEAKAKVAGGNRAIFDSVGKMMRSRQAARARRPCLDGRPLPKGQVPFGDFCSTKGKVERAGCAAAGVAMCLASGGVGCLLGAAFASICIDDMNDFEEECRRREEEDRRREEEEERRRQQEEEEERRREQETMGT